MWLFLNTCTFLTQIYAFWNIPEMTHPSLHLNEQFHFYFLLTEVCLPILNIPYSESYFDFSAKSLATEYWTGELSPDRRVHGSRPKKGETALHWESVVWKKCVLIQLLLIWTVYHSQILPWRFIQLIVKLELFNTELHNVGKHIIYVLINLIYFLKSKCKNMLSAF
jgi:hypothetical protein